MNPPTVIEFIPPEGDRVLATQAGYVIGLLDVAGYAVRGVLPDDALKFTKAVKILRIAKRRGLLLRAGESAQGSAAVFVRMGSDDARPIRARVCASGAGTLDDPIVHTCDPIATGRAILRATSIPDLPR